MFRMGLGGLDGGFGGVWGLDPKGLGWVWHEGVGTTNFSCDRGSDKMQYVLQHVFH